MPKVLLRLNYNLDAVKNAIKDAGISSAVRVNKATSYITVSCDNDEAVEKTIKALDSVTVDGVKCTVSAKLAAPKERKVKKADGKGAKKGKEREKKPRPDYASIDQVECIPNPATLEPVKNAITIADELGPSKTGHMYNNDIEGQHVQSVQFNPVKDGALGADIKLDKYDFKVISIKVTNNDVGTFVNVKLYDVAKDRIGFISLRKFNNKDGEGATLRRSSYSIPETEFDRKSEAKVPVSFVSVETITLDPETCAWSELRIAIDKAEVPANRVRIGSGMRRRFKRNFKRSK